MKRIIVSGYSIQILDGWKTKFKNNLLTLYHENGIGAVHISNYFIDSNIFEVLNLREEFIDFIVNAIDKLNRKSIKIKHQNNQFSFDTQYNKSFWQFNLKANNNKILFITYNSKLPHNSIELQNVNQMIESIIIST